MCVFSVDAFWEAWGPAASQSSLLKLEAGAEGSEELVLETAVDCNGPILPPLPPPSALKPVRDDRSSTWGRSRHHSPRQLCHTLQSLSTPNVQLSC